MDIKKFRIEHYVQEEGISHPERTVWVVRLPGWYGCRGYACSTFPDAINLFKSELMWNYWPKDYLGNVYPPPKNHPKAAVDTNDERTCATN